MIYLKCRYFKPTQQFKKVTDTFCMYASNDFSSMPAKVARANRSGYASVKVIGRNLPRIVDQTIMFSGEWKYSAKYGYTFYADSYVFLMPEKKRGIIKFLASPKFKGIGKKTAEAIVDAFGEDTLNIIENTPEKLIQVKGLDLKKIDTIKTVYAESVALNRLSVYLSTFGIKASSISNIYQKYKKDAEDVIKNNPYVLLEVKGVSFRICEQIANTINNKTIYTSSQRLVGCITEVIKQMCDVTGNMCVEYSHLEQECLKELNQQKIINIDLEMFRKAFTKAVNEGKIVCRGKMFVFLKAYDKAEEAVAKQITNLLAKPKDISESTVDSAIKDFLTNSLTYPLSNGQIEAIKLCMMNNFSILSGGAGTGKTSVVKAICSIYKSIYRKPIILLAPTGKAARRLSQATGLEACTIHSKLKLGEDYSVPTQIEDGLIVVDEASMIDNLIAEKLLNSITLESKVIFVGDDNQLTSVGSGSVLSELINSRKVPVAELKETFRQKDGSTIIDNATKVNEGNYNLTCDGDFEILKVQTEHDAVIKALECYDNEVLKVGFDNVALITPLRRTLNKFSCVSDNLNKLIQEEVNPLGSDSVSVTFNSIEYRVNDRVMQWKNNEKNSNGDIGIITQFDSNDDGILVYISWENGNDTIENAETMENIKLAYSYSIYKSQGSEYDVCIIPLVEEQMNSNFSRNLLYTAITRAKKKCIIITSNGTDVIKHCVLNPESNKRLTLLSKRLNV